MIVCNVLDKYGTISLVTMKYRREFQIVKTSNFCLINEIQHMHGNDCQNTQLSDMKLAKQCNY